MHSAQQHFTAAAGNGAGTSTQSATRLSMLESTATLLAQPNEELKKLLVAYRSKFRPTDAHEDFLVSEVAVADWRAKYIARIEQGVMWFMMASTYSVMATQDEADGLIKESPALADASLKMQTMMMGCAWVNNNKAFALLQRFQAQARRDYYKALKQLELVRTGKAGYLPKEDAPKEAAAPKPEKNETKPPADPINDNPSPGTSETKPTDPGYVLDWDVPEFFCYDPNYLENLARKDKNPRKDDDSFVKVQRRPDLFPQGSNAPGR